MKVHREFERLLTISVIQTQVGVGNTCKWSSTSVPMMLKLVIWLSFRCKWIDLKVSAFQIPPSIM